MPMAIISIWAMPWSRAGDATGLENQNVWNALTRKGMIKCEWPHNIALTPDGLAYDTGIADEILHMEQS